MDISNTNLNNGCDHSAWYFLVEFSISEFLPDHEGRAELPRQIRVYCQKKIVDGTKLTCAAMRPYDAELVVEQIQMVLDSSLKRKGGWGYFSINREADFSPDPSLNPRHCIDLYLYKEGE